MAANPGNRAVVFGVNRQLAKEGIRGLDGRVAVHAVRGAGGALELPRGRVRVAHDALLFQVAGVKLVAEGERLVMGSRSGRNKGRCHQSEKTDPTLAYHREIPGSTISWRTAKYVAGS
jgi:hypothetical protein